MGGRCIRACSPFYECKIDPVEVSKVFGPLLIPAVPDVAVRYERLSVASIYAWYAKTSRLISITTRI